MNSTPRHPQRPGMSPYRPPGGFPPSLLPPPPPNTYSPRHHYFPAPPNFSTPPPWSGSFSPSAPPPPFFTPPPYYSHLPPSPLGSLTPQQQSGHDSAALSGQTHSPSFYLHPDMPSPMMAPPHQKRKRFAAIRGHGRRGREHQSRQFRGGRGGGRRGRFEEGIDAYYDRFMLEDPWRDLLLAEREVTGEEPVSGEALERERVCDDHKSEKEALGGSDKAEEELLPAEREGEDGGDPGTAGGESGGGSNKACDSVEDNSDNGDCSKEIINTPLDSEEVTVTT